MFKIFLILLVLAACALSRRDRHDRDDIHRKDSDTPWLKSGRIHIKNDKGKSVESGEGTPVRYISILTRLGHIDFHMIQNATGGWLIKGNPPDDMIHAAVVVYGYVVEFIFDKGIDVTDEKPYLNDNHPLWEDGNFTTTRSPRQIQRWLRNNLNYFNQETYHVVRRNCLHFVKKFGKFLGGNKVEKYEDQQKWLKQNELLGNFLQTMMEARRAYDERMEKKSKKDEKDKKKKEE